MISFTQPRFFMRNKCILDWTETNVLSSISQSLTVVCVLSLPALHSFPPQTRLHSTPHVWVDCASSFSHAQICYASERSLQFAYRVCSKALDLKSGHVICQISESIFLLLLKQRFGDLRGLIIQKFFYYSCETANQTLLKSTKLMLTHD